MKRWISLFVCAACSSMLWLVPPPSVAHEPAGQSPASGHAPTKTASGFVYHDANGNRQKDADEQGLAGKKVSNGQQIVMTDADGRYEIEVADDTIVFVIKPRGWSAPLNAHQSPAILLHPQAAWFAKAKVSGRTTDRSSARIDRFSTRAARRARSISRFDVRRHTASRRQGSRVHDA